MREIEIKAKVENAVKLKEVILAYGVKLGQSIKQRDVVYCLPGSIENHKDAVWMRIRTENDSRHILTLKRSVEGHLDSIEHETVIEDADEMTAILKQMGYVLYSDLTKTRQKGKLDDIEICLDHVDGLGDFVEAEKIVEESEKGDRVRAELWQFFERVGINKTSEVLKGYDVLDRERKSQDLDGVL